jgi:hypothetical protein
MLRNLAVVQAVQAAVVVVGVIIIQSTHQLTDSTSRLQATMLALVQTTPVEVEVEAVIMEVILTELAAEAALAWLLLDTNRKKNERNTKNRN